MVATDLPQQALPCIIFDTMEHGRTIEIARAAKCSITRHPRLVELVLLLELLRPRIVEHYPTGPEFHDVESLKDHEGGPFIIRGKTKWRRR